MTAPDEFSPLTVGNGEFAFRADVTGLQSFPKFYSRDGETHSAPPGPDGLETNSELEGSTPLVTQNQWGWHRFPNPKNFKMEQTMQMYDANGKQVPYASRQHTPAGMEPRMHMPPGFPKDGSWTVRWEGLRPMQ